jgi:hypothetical protein
MDSAAQGAAGSYTEGGQNRDENPHPSNPGPFDFAQGVGHPRE